MPLLMHAQSESALWTALELKKDWTKKLATQMSGNFRTQDGVSDWDSYFAEFEVEYEFLDEFTAEVEFRRIFNQDNTGNIQGTEKWSRLRFNLKYDYKPIKGTLSARIGYQERFAQEGTDGSKRARWRYRLNYEYSIKNWKADPQIFTEYLQATEAQHSDEWRVGVSTDLNFNDSRISLRFFREERIETNRFIYIVDFTYLLEL